MRLYWYISPHGECRVGGLRRVTWYVKVTTAHICIYTKDMNSYYKWWVEEIKDSSNSSVCIVGVGVKGGGGGGENI